MKVSRFVKFAVLSAVAFLFAVYGLDALAAATSGGIGAVAGQAKKSLSNIALLITAGAYVAGLGFAVAAIVKFKAHKDNPTQIPIGMPIALLFVAAALIFVPSTFSSLGGTMFGTAGQAGTTSGFTSF